MGRNKIDIKFIENDYQRRRTFITRKPCVFKKASELSKLCGGRSCVIIDSPYEQHHDVQPPKEKAIEMVSKAEEMLRQQAIETQEGIAKLKQRNHECEMAILIREYMTSQRSTSEIGSEEARDLFRMAEERLRAVQARIGVLSSTTAPIPAQEIPRIRESQEDVQEASQEQQGLSLRQFL